MSGTWPKIIRDPIHDVIVFEDDPCDRFLLELLNTREVQRLRRIKQLGFTELVFPAATHSRFAHSLGTLDIARRFLDRFDQLAGHKLDEERRILILAAALLHDVGHGPFSHAFEKVAGQKHERYTLGIILDDSTEVNQALRARDPDLPQQLARLFDEEAEEAAEHSLPPYLVQVVSSQLDADRCDYLLRDSHATGTNYGDYDLSWLIAQLRVQADGARFFLSRKALSAAEAYLFARSHMYRAVYFHKTSRAAAVMLRLLFQRFKELFAEAPAARKYEVVPDAPARLSSAFLGPMSLRDYLRLDDHTITEFLHACAGANDDVLRRLSDGLLNRRLFKATDATAVVQAGERARLEAFDSAVRAHLEQVGLDPRFEFVDDTPGDTPYKPYNPDERNPATQIYVEGPSGQPVEISALSETVAQLRKRYVLVRYYAAPEQRNEIDKIAQATLFKGRS